MADLPEPYDYCYEWHGPWGTRKFSAASHNGRRPDKSAPLYTADQLRTYAAAQVAEAVAEIARLRDELRLCCELKREYQERAAQVAEERERCARLCEQAAPAGGRAWSTEQAACFDALTHVAAAIRATEAPNPKITGASPVETLAAPAARSET